MMSNTGQQGCVLWLACVFQLLLESVFLPCHSVYVSQHMAICIFLYCIAKLWKHVLDRWGCCYVPVSGWTPGPGQGFSVLYDPYFTPGESSSHPRFVLLNSGPHQHSTNPMATHTYTQSIIAMRNIHIAMKTQFVSPRECLKFRNSFHMMYSEWQLHTVEEGSIWTYTGTKLRAHTELFKVMFNV